MIGVILCGGESRRMGQDKGLMKFNSVSWAEIATRKLAALSIPVILSVSKLQLEKYANEFPDLKLVVDQEGLRIKGPLCGVMSVHGLFPKEDLFVLACDMLNMDGLLLKQVMEVNHHNAGYNSFIYSDGINPEPLCGIYKAGFLNQVMKKLSSGELTKHSMKFALEQGRVYVIEITEATRKYFRSLNNIEDLKDMDPPG